MVNRLNKPRRGKPIKKGSRAGQFLKERHGVYFLPVHKETIEGTKIAQKATKYLAKTYRREDKLKRLPPSSTYVKKERKEIQRARRAYDAVKVLRRAGTWAHTKKGYNISKDMTPWSRKKPPVQKKFYVKPPAPGNKIVRK